MREPVFAALDAAALSAPVMNPQLLGVVCFAADLSAIGCAQNDLPLLAAPMSILDGARAAGEAWYGSDACTQGRRGALCYRHDDELLFGAMALSEADFATGTTDTPLQRCAQSAYGDMLGLITELGYPHLYRVWNYLPAINDVSHGLERYRQFNLGREAAHAAYAGHGYDAPDNLPAACALGSAAGPINIAFLAGRAMPMRIENPRQVSAYRYPDQYGPRTPQFSRATRVCIRGQAVLFISGTASVVGHATLHKGDVAAQTAETMANLEAILAQANRAGGAPGTLRASSGPPAFTLDQLVMRVYVRHPADLGVIQMELKRLLGATPNAVYQQADICRSDLLVEIEAHAVGKHGPRR